MENTNWITVWNQPKDRPIFGQIEDIVATLNAAEIPHKLVDSQMKDHTGISVPVSYIKSASTLIESKFGRRF